MRYSKAAYTTLVQKARLVVAKAHERVRNARHNWQHKLTRRLADENQVVVKDLAVKGLMQNRHLAKAIGDAGWSGLVAKVRYKLGRRGGHLVTIGHWDASSKQCSRCDTVAAELPLVQRFWRCLSGGTLHDRDVNAAQNVLQQGLVQLKVAGLTVSACGGVRKSHATVGCSQ